MALFQGLKLETKSQGAPQDNLKDLLKTFAPPPLILGTAKVPEGPNDKEKGKQREDSEPLKLVEGGETSQARGLTSIWNKQCESINNKCATLKMQLLEKECQVPFLDMPTLAIKTKEEEATHKEACLRAAMIAINTLTHQVGELWQMDEHP